MLLQSASPMVLDNNCGLIKSCPVEIQVAMATGQVLFQRFYYSKSFVRHDVEVWILICILVMYIDLCLCQTLTLCVPKVLVIAVVLKYFFVEN